MNLTVQLLLSKLEISRLQRINLATRAAILTLFLWLFKNLADSSSGFSNGPTLCLFRSFTGLPCPFCGTTRSIGHILMGDFYGAVYLNPLGYVGLIFFVTLFISPKAISLASSNLAGKWWNLNQRTQITITVSTLIFAWILNLPRLV